MNIDKNRFYWNSRPPRENASYQVQPCLSGGVVTLYMELYDCTFREAVANLAKKIDLEAQIQKRNTSAIETPKNLTIETRHKSLLLQLNEKGYQNYDMRKTKGYLVKTRSIDVEIVDMFINKKYLYETQDKEGRTQAVFVGKNEYGLLSSCCFRSTYSNSSFKGDYSNCDYDRGWFFEPERDITYDWYADPDRKEMNTKKSLLVFESSIEMMSYMTILKETGWDINKFAYLSCGSISKTRCVAETCKIYGYKKVVIMFNNDLKKEVNPGREAAIRLQSQLVEQGIKTDIVLPDKANDWNDTLRLYKNRKLELNNSKKKIHNKNILR